MAKTDRLRHRHLRRHGLPHPRPGFHVAGAAGPEVDPLRRRRAQAAATGGSTRRCATSSRAPTHTTETLSLTWYDGDKRPPDDVKTLIGKRAAGRPGVDLHRHRRRPLLALHRCPRAAPRREVQRRKAAQPRRQRPLPPVRRSLPRQRQDLGAIRLLRAADRIGLARLPGDPVPEARRSNGTPRTWLSPTFRRPTPSSDARIARVGRSRASESAAPRAEIAATRRAQVQYPDSDDIPSE